MDDCNALAEAMRAEVCRALAGGAACPLTVEHVAQIVVPRVLTSVQHWQDQPVIAGLLVEDRVAVAAGATPAPAHTEVGSCVNSNDADGDGGIEFARLEGRYLRLRSARDHTGGT